MGEKFTSRVGYLIRNFRIASDMTQKELADKCGLNESTIRNYELGNRYPDAATLLNIANNLNVSFYALSDPDVANIFSALHVLFDIEWAYGLRPTMKDGELTFKFEERLSCTSPRPQEYLDNFRKMVEYWARLRDRLEDGEITESEYYLKEIKELISFGGSPRASINLALAARSYAFIKRRGYVVPEDVRAIAHDVLRHRIGLTYEAEATNVTQEELVSRILNKVEVP